MIALLLALALHSPSFAADEKVIPEAHALQIAESSAFVTQARAQLQAEARKIGNSALRDAALEILERPNFRIRARAGESSAIRSRLLELKLLNKEDEPQELFPSHEPMLFRAAPASIWAGPHTAGHHTYPGGLVVHVLTNVRHGVALATNWTSINHIHLNLDPIRAGAIWHDCAKTWTLRWNADGTATTSEGKIAGTAAHHVLGVAEAIYRGLPADFVVTLASAHTPPHPPTELGDLIHYLQAASIIAGKSYRDAGLTDDGSALAKPAPLQSFLHHLSDHDFIGSEVIMAGAVHALAEAGLAPDAWAQDEKIAKYGDLKIYSTWLDGGTPAVRALFVAKP